jgi:hypothetical protein
MKNIIFLSLLLLGFKAEAQKGIIFKIKYLPNHTYSGAINIAMNCNATLSGNDTIISKLTSQGITQPITADITLKMDGNTQTSAVDADGTFPLTMKYKFDDLSADINGNSIPIPTEKLGAGGSIYGHVGKDGKLKADSIGGKKMADTSEEKVSKMMNAIQKNIEFPDHPMNIGETFTQDMPLSVPMGGNSMDIDTKVVYKLVSVADGNAYFDVQQRMNMTIPISGSSIIINGTGTGKLVYSIKNNFATDYSSNLVIKISGKIKALQVDATAKVDMDYKYEIQ